jgi:eukaryotic translation initiation factor 2C
MSDRGNYRGRGPSRGRGGPADRSRGRGSPAPSSSHDSRSTTPGDHRGRGGGGGGPPRGYDQHRGGQGGGGYRGGGGGGGHRGGAPGSAGIFAENVQPQIPSRLSGAELQKLIDGFKSIKIKPERPLRPGYGTVGAPVTLRANFFAMRVPQGPIYDYVVEISPKTDINRLKIRIFQLLELSPLCRPYLPHIAHDRSQRLVSAKKLPQPLDIPVPFYEDNQAGPPANATVYTVSIKFERELDTRQLTKCVIFALSIQKTFFSHGCA